MERPNLPDLGQFAARHEFCFCFSPLIWNAWARRATVATSAYFGWRPASHAYKEQKMTVLALTTPVLLAAAGYSLLYLLLGGGLGGAILIFIVAKMLGK